MDIITDLVNWFVQNWLGIVVGAILSAIISYVFYVKQIKEKNPCYSKHSVKVIGEKASKIESLEISFSKQPVKNLTITYLAFWNNGKDVIRREDISPDNPILLLTIPGYKIYQAKVVNETSVNGFTVSKINDYSYKIDFSYLNKGQGALIKVFHDGLSDLDIIIKGDIIGGKEIKKIEWEEPRGNIKIRRGQGKSGKTTVIDATLLLSVSMIIMSLIALSISIGSIISDSKNGMFGSFSNNTTDLLFTGVVLVYLVWNLSKVYKIIFGPKIPGKLSTLNDED